MNDGRLATPLCRRLGIELPLIQAPIGSATTPELAAAVSNAGGLGMLAGTWVDPETLELLINRTRELTSRPFGVNLVLAFPFAERLDIALRLGVPVVSTAWGDPTPARQMVDSAALLIHAAGSVVEATDAASAGVDAVVAQGWEAGGHVLGTTASLPLIPAVADAVSPVPVIAAGGIGDGRGVAAALVLGAQAAMIGTRFLAATESAAHDAYRDAVVGAGADSTAHSFCFSGGWPDAPHRAIANTTLAEWELRGRTLPPNRPGENEVIAVDAAGREWRRYDDMMPLTGMVGELEAMALYAGQSAGTVRDIRPAGEIVRSMAAEAVAALTHWQTTSDSV